MQRTGYRYTAVMCVSCRIKSEIVKPVLVGARVVATICQMQMTTDFRNSIGKQYCVNFVALCFGTVNLLGLHRLRPRVDGRGL